MGDLAVAYILTVQPDIKTGIDSFKIQVAFRSKGILFIGKMMYISSAGILLRYKRRIHGKRITDVRILMVVITVILPAGRNRKRFKTSQICIGFKKRLLQIINALIITELPGAVQQFKAIRMLSVFHKVRKIISRRNVVSHGDIIGTIRHRIFM